MPVTKPWYDTKEGIEAAVKKGLDGIHELAAVRGEAGYKRKERMNDWIVCSYFSFDSCGNVMLITEGAPDYYTFKEYPPQVFDMTYYKAYAKDDRGWTATSNNRFPKTGDVCPQCLEGWDLRNVANYKFTSYGDEKGYHKDCHDLKAAASEREYFEELLDSAIHYTKLTAIPCGYGRSSARPWFMVETAVGPIKIGWRKRVISISWDNATGINDVDGEKVFADQQVTKSFYNVHAWGKEKAVEYLQRLIPVLEQMSTI